MQVGNREQETALCSVYMPTNHVYVGDIYLLPEQDVIRTNLSVREGLGACDKL
jgi:uncharacterized membrane protein